MTVAPPRSGRRHCAGVRVSVSVRQTETLLRRPIANPAVTAMIRATRPPRPMPTLRPVCDDPLDFVVAAASRNPSGLWLSTYAVPAPPGAWAEVAAAGATRLAPRERSAGSGGYVLRPFQRSRTSGSRLVPASHCSRQTCRRAEQQQQSTIDLLRPGADCLQYVK